MVWFKPRAGPRVAPSTCYTPQCGQFLPYLEDTLKLLITWGATQKYKGVCFYVFPSFWNEMFSELLLEQVLPSKVQR